MNSKEIKKILRILEEQFGYSGKLDYAFFLGSKNRLYILSKDFARFDEKKVRIASLGLYFGELKEDTIRLSVEASQLLGPHCTRNIVEITPSEEKRWMFGESLSAENQKEHKGFMIVRCGKDYLGCTSFTRGELLNFVPKSRYIGTLN